MEQQAVVAGVKVSMGFAFVYMGAILYQCLVKLREDKEQRRQALGRHKKEEGGEATPTAPAGRRFHRYDGSNLAMLRADRIVGNLLEFAPLFFLAFWGALAIVPAAELPWVIAAGWGYVLTRATYPFVVVLTGAIGTSGAKPWIVCSTIPSYCCMLYLTYKAVYYSW